MRGWRIGRIFGIEITIDPSWFIIVGLTIYLFGFLEFPRELNPRALRPRADWFSVSLGILTSLLLFGSVLLHELSHSWMAIQRGIPVKRITLFIFGGVAQISKEPDRPFSEFLIAIMGPLMSVALAVIFGGAWLWLQILNSAGTLGLSLTPLILVTNIVFQVNGTLAIFNLAPGFPLDGGRVLRAVLWGFSRNIQSATMWASRLGQFIALLLIGSAVVVYFAGYGIGGIWNAMIGLFLWNAASDGYRQTLMIESLRGATVHQLMTTSVESISPDLSIAEFVDFHLLHRRDQTFVVSNGLGFQGIIGVQHIRGIPREAWSMRRVRDVMTSAQKIPSIDPGETAASALNQLATTDSDELVVIEASQVIGFIGQSELARYLKLKTA